MFLADSRNRQPHAAHLTSRDRSTALTPREYHQPPPALSTVRSGFVQSWVVTRTGASQGRPSRQLRRRIAHRDRRGQAKRAGSTKRLPEVKLDDADANSEFFAQGPRRLAGKCLRTCAEGQAGRDRNLVADGTPDLLDPGIALEVVAERELKDPVVAPERSDPAHELASAKVETLPLKLVCANSAEGLGHVWATEPQNKAVSGGNRQRPGGGLQAPRLRQPMR